MPVVNSFFSIKIFIMVSIHGLVLVKESNAGIPNLVVRVYDSSVTMRDLITDHPSKNIFEPPFIEKWGKRIGSVLTDAKGTFSLSKENFPAESGESKTHLLLVVFAPEDVQDMKQPFVLPPEQRILYISAVPRQDAVHEEVYVIRLLQSQLDKFQIHTGNLGALTKTSDTESRRLSDAIENSYLFKEQLKAKLKARLSDQEKKTQAMKQKAIEKTKNLSAIPLSKRNHPLLVSNQEELKAAQKKSITEGLKNLNKYKPKIRLSLTPDELKSIGGKTPKKGKLSTHVQTTDLAEFIFNKIGGVSLVKKKTKNTSVADEILKKYLNTVQTKIKLLTKRKALLRNEKKPNQQ